MQRRAPKVCKRTLTRRPNPVRRAATRPPLKLRPVSSPVPPPASTDDRIRELEARLVAHGIVLQAVVRVLSESSVAELKAAAQGIDDEGMQEANPDVHMRGVAEEMWSILEMAG